MIAATFEYLTDGYELLQRSRYFFYKYREHDQLVRANIENDTGRS